MGRIEQCGGSNLHGCDNSNPSSNQSDSSSPSDLDSSSSISTSSNSDPQIKTTQVKILNKRVESSTQYPLASKIWLPKVLKFRTAEVTRSTLTGDAILSLLRYPHSGKVQVFAAEPEDRIHIPIEGTVGFYAQALSCKIGLHVHPFFISILNSYGIVPSQLTPFVWCRMLGTLFVWEDLGFGKSSLNIWHYLYKIHPVNNHPEFYFVSKWSKGGPMLITELPSSNGGWWTRFFYLDIESGGSGLQDYFDDASGCLLSRIIYIYILSPLFSLTII